MLPARSPPIHAGRTSGRPYRRSRPGWQAGTGASPDRVAKPTPEPITVAEGRQLEAIDDHGFPNRRDARPHRRARHGARRRRARPDPAQGLASVAGRQGRRARRDGADHRPRGGGSQRRAGHPDLSRRVAVQAHPAMGRDGPGPARHLGLPARLRERQASAVQRHPDAGPGQEPRARQAPEQFAVHGGHQADHRRAGRDGAVGRLARRRLRQQGRVRARAGGRPGQGDALGRAGVRADAGGGRRLDQLDAELGDLHRAADRRARCRQHQLGQLRVVPDLRAGRLPDAARRPCAVVHVRADPDVQGELRAAHARAAAGAAGCRPEGRGLLLRGGEGPGSASWSRPSRRRASRSGR